nr:hypothetical protein [uncultured Albidiferax sp.]
MGLTKTDKARAELRPGQRSLGQRERALLLLADGRKTAHEMAAYLGHEGEALVLRLLRDGYLTHPAVAAQPVAADRFDGKRSLATTRMFLFDICERMFARRAPGRAESLREALRNARDRSAMLKVSHAMLADIEATAGPERANTIRKRINLLLPEALAA